MGNARNHQGYTLREEQAQTYKEEVAMGVYHELRELHEQVEDCLLDAQKFDEGNSSAGTRVTKMLSDVGKKAKSLRQMVFETRKGR